MEGGGSIFGTIMMQVNRGADQFSQLCKNSGYDFILRFLPKSAPPLPFNIPVPSSRNELLFRTPSAFPLFILTILAHLCLPVFRIMYFVM